MKHLSLPLIAALLFAACGSVAAATMQFTLREFAIEAGVNGWIFVAVPGLVAAVFAMIVYQGAEKHVKNIGQSVSRGLLVALLSWGAFSALATAVWFPIEDFFQWLSTILLISGAVGGGPMLLAALIAGALVGLLIKQRGSVWILKN